MNQHEQPYQTILEAGSSEFRDRNSRFLGFAFRVNTEEEVKTILEGLSSKHPKSRHIVYAFRIGKGGEFSRLSDDGEPSGSSGRPIFNQIQSSGLHNILVAVVRYFGGTKLGIPGLINAYGEAAKLAIDSATIQTIKPVYQFLILAEYSLMGKLMDVVKSMEGLEIVRQDFSSGLELFITAEKSNADYLIQLLKCQMAEVPMDAYRQIEIKGMNIKLIKN